ncbi:MAG: PAS domain-containing protein [Planctomycetaceae bacterium]|nr:PAS domain-containing protein [Planctomycetaceae bacterium]MBT4846087.1 PAS domain-containing protein [Planctomycetaceae bacterium]MBT5598709.1 PAS domain-containing protein [Planctomycetaceae bacterium]MBT7916144.1 PAS domain-containing protein [Planctomycetaceae bacterium]
MWSTRLFWKPFTYFSLLIILGCVIGGATTISWQHEQIIHQVELRLRNTAISLQSPAEDALAKSDLENFQRVIATITSQIDTRITLIEKQGQVLADSQTDPQQLDNHGDRPELIAALKNGHGKKKRFSDSLGIEMLYIAYRVEHQGTTVGFIRAALGTQQISDQVADIQLKIATLVLIIIAGGLSIAGIGIAKMTQPVVQLIEEARELTSGQIKKPRNLSKGNEFDELGQTLNNLSKTLSKRMRQLERNHNELLVVLEGMKEGVIAVDGSDCIRFANEAVCRMFSLDVNRDEGRPIWEVLRNQMIETTVHKARKSDEPFHGKIELLTPHEQHLSLSASAIPNSNHSASSKKPGVIIVFHDITEIHRLENMRRDFVANVSHELKTPLASIQAFAETLIDGAIHDEDNNMLFLTRIVEQSDRLNLLIQDLLSIARLESGDNVTDFATVDLTEITQRCLNDHRSHAAKKNITLVFNQSDSVWVFAEADGLTQILDNLVDNALKYTPADGTVTVNIQAEPQTVHLKVTDTGIGIPVDHQDRIFERFYRVDKARSRQLGGTGLGLAIVKHLVNAFGAEVDVISAANQGTTFQITFPLVDDADV